MVFCYQNYCTVRKNCSSDRENFLKFEAEGREFAKNLRSLEQSARNQPITYPNGCTAIFFKYL